MGIRTTVRWSVLLLISILITDLLAQSTALEWLSWVTILLSGLLFMTLYWLGICCIALWSEREDIAPIKKVDAPQPTAIDDPVQSYESMRTSELGTGQIVPE